MNKIDTKKLKLLPVPEGLRMRYKHHYLPAKCCGDVPEAALQETPPKLVSTEARLEREDGFPVQVSLAIVNPKDVPIKKLGRIIAHNRCIKAFHKAQQEQQHG